MVKCVAITGASGFIGSALTRVLEANAIRVIRIGRGRSADVQWRFGAAADGAQDSMDAAEIAPADAVVNLAGANIGVRWTAAHKREIRESRVRATRLIVRSLGALPPRQRVLLSASATGYYGTRGDDVLTEASAPGAGFLAEVTTAWEREARMAEDAGVRVVCMRMGVPLAEQGGILERMLPPFRLGVGGPLGSGEQWLSWIALNDLTRAMQFLMTSDMRGAVNVVSPTPMRNADFARALGAVLGRPSWLSAPAFALRALFLDMADEALLASQRVVPARLQEAGFTFSEPAVDGALRRALEAAS